MRIYPHHPDPQTVSANYATAQSLLVRRAARTPEFLSGMGERFWKHNAATAIDCACAAYALEEDDRIVHDFLREASDCFADGLARSAPFTMSEMSDFVSVALIVGDDARAALPASLPPERYMSPSIIVFKVVHRVFQIYVALAAGMRDVAADLLHDSAAVLDSQKLPRKARILMANLLALQRAIVDADGAQLNTSLNLYVKDQIARFKDPDLADLPQGLIHLQGMGLIRLARRAHLDVRIDSVYLPVDLLGPR